jgi:hypothetical protein
MKILQSSEIPILPVKDIINNESVAFGVFDVGIIVQYMERDTGVLIEWPDIISFGSELLKVSEKKPDTEIEIEKPTEID